MVNWTVGPTPWKDIAKTDQRPVGAGGLEAVRSPLTQVFWRAGDGDRLTRTSGQLRSTVAAIVLQLEPSTCRRIIRAMVEREEVSRPSNIREDLDHVISNHRLDCGFIFYCHGVCRDYLHHRLGHRACRDASTPPSSPPSSQDRASQWAGAARGYGPLGPPVRFGRGIRAFCSRSKRAPVKAMERDLNVACWPLSRKAL